MVGTKDCASTFRASSTVQAAHATDMGDTVRAVNRAVHTDSLHWSSKSLDVIMENCVAQRCPGHHPGAHPATWQSARNA